MTAARGHREPPRGLEFLLGPVLPLRQAARWRCRSGRTRRGELYDTVVMQDGREGWLGFHESMSSREPYFCRPVMAERDERRRHHLPDAVHQREGEAGRVDQELLPAARRSDDVQQRATATRVGGDASRVHGQRDAATRALNDLDAVAAATPAYGAPYTGSWMIPAALPAGDYALCVEVNKEFDGNARTSHPVVRRQNLADGLRLDGNFGQPSVVYRVPIHTRHRRGAAGERRPLRDRRLRQLDRRGRRIIPRDGTISPTNPGSGEARLLGATAAGTGRRARRHRAVRPTTCAPPPPPPGSVTGLPPIASALGTPSAALTFSARRRRRRRGRQLRDPLPRGRPAMSDFVRRSSGDPRRPRSLPGAPGAPGHVDHRRPQPATRLHGRACARRTPAGRPRPSWSSRSRRPR